MMLKYMLVFIIFFYSLCLVSCRTQLASGEESNSILKEEHLNYEINFASFYKKILGQTYSANLFYRNPKLYGQPVFSKILNLRPEDFVERKAGQRSIFVIPSFSEKKRDYIVSQIPKELYNSGFEIFSPLFWRKLWKLSNEEEFYVGFIKYIPGEKNLNGFYNSTEKTIGFDSMAISGTVAHELRHHDQHMKTVRSHKSVTIYENKKCQKTMKRAFAELDASSFDLKYLSGVAISNDAEYITSVVGLSEQPSMMIFSNVKVSLSYPEMVLNSLANDINCSRKIRDAAKSIVKKIELDVSDLKKLLMDLDRSVRLEVRLIQRRCQSQLEKKEECSKVVAQSATTRRLSKEFEDLLANVISVRFETVKKVLLELPDNYLQFMRLYIIGVASLLEEERG